MTRLEAFDLALLNITQDRGKIYGHPAENFRDVARLIESLPPFEDQRIKHAVEMICIKICRLSQTPSHIDSWVDIAGYARTAVMIIDKDIPTKE